MSDLMREQFEAWAATNAFLGLSESCMERHNEGYLGCELHAAWEAWLASRECLVIELPDQGPSFTVAGVTSFSLKNEGRNEAINEIEVSIHAVGVQTK